MTVPSSVAKSGPYNCNGVTDVFNYDFRIVDKAHLKVILADANGDETTLDLTTHYTVSDVGSDTGSINLTAAGVALAVNGTTLTVLRNPPFTQETDLQNQGPYLAQTVEDRFDLLTMQVQTVKERSDRSIAVPASDDGTTLGELTADLIRLADSADSIDMVAGIETEVTIVAGIAADVTTVAGVASGIPAVADVADDIPTVAAIAADIPTIADNIEDVNTFSKVYLGAKASAPTTRNDGSALEAGDQYFDTTTDKLKIYTGSAWVGGTGDLVSTANLSDVSDKAAALANIGGFAAANVIDEDDMASDSATKVPTQQSVKAYVDGQTSAEIEFTQSGTGAVARAAQEKLRETVSVEDFGASETATAAENTTAFQATIDSLPAIGGTIYLTALDYDVTTASLDTGGRNILWVGNSRINGGVYRQLPGLNEGFSPDNNRRRIFYEDDPVADSFIRYDFQKNSNYSGGTTGVSSVMRVYTVIGESAGAVGQTVGEWPLQARVDNYSDNAQGVALTGQGRRYGKAATWASHFNAIDNIDASTTSAAVWGYEANIQGDGADPDMLRRVGGVIAHNVAQVYSGTPGTDVIGVGLYVYPDTADYTYGMVIETFAGAGTTNGKILDTALLIDAAAPTLISAINPTGAGLIKFGSRVSTGIVSQILGVGNNSASSAFNFTDIRAEINTNTAGAEDGRWRVYVAKDGVMTEYIRINAGVASPISLNVAGTLKAVTEGAADSGGTGYRALCVPN